MQKSRYNQKLHECVCEHVSQHGSILYTAAIKKGKKSIKSNQQSNYTVSLKEWGSLVGFLHNNKQDFKLFLFELLMGNKGENILV